MQAKDDSLKRWEKQPEINNRIWDYFNTHVSKKIIFAALENKLTLEALFFQLALARAKCEYIKEYISTQGVSDLSNENLDFLSTHFVANQIIQYHSSKPGHFLNFNYGVGREPIITFNYWGKIVEAFSMGRLNNPHKVLEQITPGVSSLYDGCLYHKAGFALNKADFDLQNMAQATNLFEYFKHASRLVYLLSNSPPIARGTSSISSWLMDIVGQKEFGFIQSIRPSLFDWAAFYESPEQYTSFFVIAATVEYLKSLDVYPEIDAFAAKVKAVLMKNPNGHNEIAEREALWDELKTIIQTIVTAQLHEKEPKLTEKQINNLVDLCEGFLPFRKISEQAIRIGQLLSHYQHGSDIENLDVLSNKDRAYFLKLNQLKCLASRDFLATYGNTSAEQEANVLWPDVEYLASKRLLPAEKFSPFYSSSKSPLKIEADNKWKKYDIVRTQCRLIGAGCFDAEELDNYMGLEAFITSTPLLEEVRIALHNGLKLNELNELFLQNKLTIEQLELLTGNLALLLYQNHYSVKLLLGNNCDETEKNILVHAICFQYQAYFTSTDLETLSHYIQQACTTLRRTTLLQELEHYSVITKESDFKTTLEKTQKLKLFYSSLVIEAKDALKNVDSPNYKGLDAFITSTPLLKEVRIALQNGLELNELNALFLENKLTIELLELLTGKASLLLYQNHYSLKSFFGNNCGETETTILMHAIRMQNQAYFNPTDLETVSHYIQKACPALRRTSLLQELQQYSKSTKDDHNTTYTKSERLKILYSNLLVEAKDALKNVDSSNYKRLEEFITSTSLLKEVRIALHNGLKLNELNELFLENKLTIELLELLTGKAALLLYQHQNYRFSFALKSPLGNNCDETEKNILVYTIRSQYEDKARSRIKDFGFIEQYIKKACPALRRASLLQELQHCSVQDAQKIEIFYSNLVIEAKDALKNLDSPKVAQMNKQQRGDFFNTQPTANKKEVDENESKIVNIPFVLQ